MNASVLTSLWRRAPSWFIRHKVLPPTQPPLQVGALSAVSRGLDEACVARDGRRPLLSDVKAEHIRDSMRRLGDVGTPEGIDLDISPLRGAADFQPLYVLTDTLGPLGTTTVQIAFGIVPRSNVTVVLGIFLGSAPLRPLHIALIENRFETYLLYEKGNW